MLGAPARDWHVCQQLFAEHWDGFTHAHPRDQTAYYEGLVATRRRCGDPDQMGSVAYRCLQGGQGTHRVAMRCQSSWCLRCAKVHVDNWVSQVSTRLHEGVISRHIILTVPAMFRTTFSHHAAVLLSALMRCGVQCLDDFYREVRGKGLKGGSIVVLHTHGRTGHDPPPRHLIATSGGYEEQGERWEPLHDLPAKLLHRKWQWHLLRLVRQTLQTEVVNQWVERCFKQSPHGLVRTVQQGTVPSQSQSLARDVATYVVSPPIAVRRIDR